MSKRREQALEQIIRDTLWMARRYADGRRTSAPATVNTAILYARRHGVEIEPDRTLRDPNGEFATDGMLGTVTLFPENA